MIQAGDAPAWANPANEDKNCCIQCGRTVGKNPLWIEIIKGGVIREQDGNQYDSSADAGYMGWFPVGSECAKLFKSSLLTKQEAK